MEGEHVEFVRASFDPERMSLVYPLDLDPYLTSLRKRFSGKLRVLDVGCGPCSLLSLGQMRGAFDLSGVDPLADEYRPLVRQGGMQTVGALYQGFGENLSALFAAESFHLVYCCNALDHTQSPAKTLAEMCGVLMPGGTLFLQGYSREGSANRFHGLHQHDLFLEPGGRLMCQDRLWPLRRGGRTRCISESLPLDIVYQSAESDAVKHPLRAVYHKRAE